MGNRLGINKVVSQTEKHGSASARELEAIKRMQELTPTKLKMMTYFVSGTSKKKTARFRASHVKPKAGVLIIKAVVTRQELKQILNYKSDMNYSSLDHLVTVMKSRGPWNHQLRINDEDEGVNNSNWRPALKCIPGKHVSGSCI
ncbi:hypothetical protein Pint_02037 [Pistacia integerrima]|uniref:Uncharacterized protein n=1 Tax=Pistacia integerrima TaxID=434235 RepID=A0ACC0ZF89_9ROSI|nr:hypothetical protein Pint_02037 [Pistacia integerrima]